jgi:hypothetical protein
VGQALALLEQSHRAFERLRRGLLLGHVVHHAGERHRPAFPVELGREARLGVPAPGRAVERERHIDGATRLEHPAVRLGEELDEAR